MAMQWLFFAVASLAGASMGSVQQVFAKINTQGIPQEPIASGTSSMDHEEGVPEYLVSQEVGPIYGESVHDPMDSVEVDKVPDSSSPVTANEEMTGSAVPAKAYPLRGFKSLIVGSAVLVFTSFLLLSDMLLEDNDSFARRFSESTSDLLNYMDNRLAQVSPNLRTVVPGLVFAAGPALILSGLVGLVASWRLRRVGGGRTLPLRGLVLVVLGSLALAFMILVPKSKIGKDDMEIIKTISWGFILVGLFTGLGGWLGRRTKQNRALGKPRPVPLPNLPDPTSDTK